MTAPIENAQLVWDRLVREKVVSTSHYDQELVHQLRAALRIRARTDFRAALADVSAETFIVVLLQAIAPFARMMVELLELCEEIHATHSDAPNLTIRFNFDDTADALDIDLTVFRATTTRFRHVTVARPTRIWDGSALRRIHGRVGGLVEALRGIGARTSGLLRQKALESWPALAAPPPTSGVSALDRVLAKLWRLRSDFVAEASGRWPDRHRDQFAAADMEMDQVRQLRGVVSDLWDHSLGAYITEIARVVGAAAQPLPADITSEIDRFVRDADGLVDELPVIEQLVEQEIRELIDLLSLPMWGKRHDLYAAWVFPRIVDAIGLSRLHFRVPDGLLSFDFKGSHLATFDTVDGFAQVWAELRAPYYVSATGRKLLGKSRSRNVQPDYSVTFEPKDAIETTFLAVECKQYRRASSDHAKALHDYTLALPNATVVLAAYGPVSRNVLGRVDPAAQTRAGAVGQLRPDRASELDTFGHLLSSVILAAPAVVRAAPEIGDERRVISRQGMVCIELTWQTAGVDLDLHAWLADGTHVDYSARWAPHGSVRLLEDVRRPPGPEVLLIDGSDRVDVFVHSYSSQPVAQVGAQLRIRTSGDPSGEILTVATDFDDARWFHACTVLADRIEIVAQFSVDPPL